MAEDSYDEVTSRLPGGRLTKQDIQRARYGSKLDERRHEFLQGIIRLAKLIGALTAIAGGIVQAFKLFHIGGF